MLRILSAVLVISTTASCSILAPLFGGGDRAEDASPYAAAMADFSLCETASSEAERAAAAARLAAAAGTMSSVSQPSNTDHFYEMDRVVAAHDRCQAVLSSR
ncbi:hypothetical protein KUL25_20545 [Rhodobacteraceae bacterium N5(2021)]|uniref:Lipoprotein n=1 Tax=Gymnodinialimonas phycosphaerae TaxID=2841589 RepID=A0ABS7MYG4_9RHOB|nr:hypothetical protein [Gymnodinialimonas phycosphaerae]MBY4895158.1 hypothetical protein [Gymnodinialimonas phycosphaerae]